MKTVYKETQIIYDRLSPRENNFYNNKKILLLGADGFIGKAFINYFYYLIKKGKNFIYIVLITIFLQANKKIY